MSPVSNLSLVPGSFPHGSRSPPFNVFFWESYPEVGPERPPGGSGSPPHSFSNRPPRSLFIAHLSWIRVFPFSFHAVSSSVVLFLLITYRYEVNLFLNRQELFSIVESALVPFSTPSFLFPIICVVDLARSSKRSPLCRIPSNQGLH